MVHNGGFYAIPLSMKRLNNPPKYGNPMTAAKDLTKEAPRSPRTRLGDYALMARMIDKGRATLNGTLGEYHYACPLDQMLFTYKGVQAPVCGVPGCGLRRRVLCYQMRLMGLMSSRLIGPICHQGPPHLIPEPAQMSYSFPY
jgi:Domain of unknown function (DUF5069)